MQYHVAAIDPGEEHGRRHQEQDHGHEVTVPRFEQSLSTHEHEVHHYQTEKEGLAEGAGAEEWRHQSP